VVYGPGYRKWLEVNPGETLPDREALYRFIFEREGLDCPIDYLEFGVYKGSSIRWWLEKNCHPESRFVGFDCFDGLPEKWGEMPEGTFSTFGAVPEVADERCSFVKGYFQDTLPNWLISRDFRRKTIVHLDADLYSSTLLVLLQVLPRLKRGDIIIFDEFGSYLDEYRALVDATVAYPIEFTAVGQNLMASGYCQRVAIKIK